MLSVKIYSFSYKKSGIPKDDTPNMGGFVIDCRFIYNPGRKEEFKNLTGKDKDVKDFLDNDSSMKQFLKNVYEIIDAAVDNFTRRDFTSLMVSFGCTGGQHRSVYAAESLNAHLKNKYDGKIGVVVKHTELMSF
jgi:RNase adaptor protein for sRNA GlmZ degradation